ncbi:Cdc6/Cdc18 family protein [Halalkalicoccus subterraneus]|uniref:Cdc6/Cdc18 family protein n=1 Tax=Halalkalicoccus subterraneus TaxID=2675002 RepID=UPI000EFBE8AB|nr:AAA family ATPase [Halalkalicoccus subterraneus]
MNIEERVARRRRGDDGPQLVRSYDALSPAAHVRDPDGRGSALEQLLDHLEPALDGALPANAYVWGPKGAGKSALVTALFTELDRVSAESRTSIHTSTRVDAGDMAAFAYVDGRRTRSEFGLRHAILDALLDDRIPKQGIGDDHLVDRLEASFAGTGRTTVVAVDHLGESTPVSVDAIEAFLGRVPDSIAWLAIGRRPPEEYGTGFGATVHLSAYQRYALVDVLTSRASRGLAHQAISHEELRRIATWAGGDAHDALAALFGAAVRSDEAGERTIDTAAVDGGIDAVPRPGAAIGRVLALPENRQRVLRRLLDLETTDRSIEATAAVIAHPESLDLSAATVKRFLYELAESGILRRTRAERTDGLGRPPSRVEPQFPTLVFRQVFDATNGSPDEP